jgi:hypothetical protein
MAAYEDRKRDQNKCSDQAASPPSILFQYLLLKTVETRFQAFLRCFLLISGPSWFLRHNLLPLFFSSRRGYEQSACPSEAEPRVVAPIMPRLMQRRSAMAEVSRGEQVPRRKSSSTALRLGLGQQLRFRLPI